MDDLDLTTMTEIDATDLRSINHLPDGFVYLSDICPSILQDMRYATNNNFTGETVTGYENGVAILTREAAEALYKIQQKLEEQNLSLSIWDAYRPTQSIDNFLAWKQTPDDQDIKAKYYPEFNKNDLFRLGFIAQSNSTHSRGSTVDLTIIDKKTNEPLDMGTDFDFFGEKSYTENTQISSQAIANRKFLKRVMEKYGFKGIPQEWWHYTLKNEPFPDKYFNFVVK